MDAVKDRTTEQTSVVQGTLTLTAGTRVMAGGYPVRLTGDVTAETHASNVALIEREIAEERQAEHGGSER